MYLSVEVVMEILSTIVSAVCWKLLVWGVI